MQFKNNEIMITAPNRSNWSESVHRLENYLQSSQTRNRSKDPELTTTKYA